MKIPPTFVILIIAAVNVCLPILIRRYTVNQFYKTKKVEETLYKMKILQQYVQNAIIILSTFLFTYTLSLLMNKNEITKIILLVSPFLFIFIIILSNQIIYHNISRIIRDVDTTIIDELANASQSFFLLILPCLIIVLLRIEILNRLNLNQYLNVAAIIIMIVMINVLYPYMIKIIYRTTSIKSPDMKTALLSMVEKHNLKRVKIFEWSTAKNKVANAIVCGILETRIYISDYLMDNLSLKEIEAILAHEIGHLKKFHLWIRVAIIVLAIPLFTGLGSLMDFIQIYYKIQIPIPLGIALFFILLFLYFGFMYLLFSRFQERQADEYAINSGVDVNTFISALRKIAKLNNSVVKLNKVDEKLQTHPSFEHRIKWLEKISIYK
jgi:STE24 endopeptidase